MDLQNIQEQLNTEYAKQDTRIIFWFDDKGDYENEVIEIELNNARLHILDGSNWLYSKWLLHESDSEGKYLVYAPISRPSDAENPLADLYYYSVPYYTDRISQMSQEIGIDNRFKEHLAKYSNFWKNKHRIEKFKELGIDHFTIETIDIGLMAVLCDVKTPNLEEVVKQLMLCDNADYFKALDTNGLTESFWNLCKKYFGYESDKPSMDDIVASMIVTYATGTLKNTMPDALKTYILPKRNDVVVFIRNIMDNILYRDSYDVLAEKVDKALRFTVRISENLKKDEGKDSASLADILACDAFVGLDNILIDWVIDKIEAEVLDAEIDGLNISRIVTQRASKAFHYSDKFKAEYEALKNAYMLMKAVDSLEVSGESTALIKKYQEDMYLIDSYYRWFYHAYDKIGNNDRFANIRERVENIYSNTYLQKLTPKWNESFTDQTVQSLGLTKQVNFYKHYLKAYEAKNNRINVIISDAFRYECARELFERLEQDEKCEPKMECMLSGLP